MRIPFAHDATVVMAPDSDDRAPGAAVTVALCGSWEHDPPCPLAPHHTSAARAGELVRLHVLFAAEPGDEPEVRRRIDEALRAGTLTGPDGTRTGWELRGTTVAEVTDAERERAARLAAG